MICSAATRRVAGMVSVAIALGVAGPAAARPFDLNNHGSFVSVQPALTQPSSAPAGTGNATGGGISDLGYVAIGSGSAALALIGVGGTRVASRRRRHRLTVQQPTTAA
jgi:hypothetical protein